MSEHAWAEEHVATYLAGGLDALEAERLEAHARECPACAASLAAARQLEHDMDALFAGVSPGPEMEDRVIGRLRTGEPRRAALFAGWPARIAALAASILILGGIGAMANVAADGLPMPGSPLAKRESARAPQSSPAARYPANPNRSYAEEVEAPPDDADANFKKLQAEYDRGDALATKLQANVDSNLRDLDTVRKRANELESAAAKVDTRKAQFSKAEAASRREIDAGVTQDNLGKPNAPDTDTTALALPGLNTGDLSARGYTNGSTTAGKRTKPVDPYRMYTGVNPTKPAADSVVMGFDSIPKPDPKFDGTRGTGRDYYGVAPIPTYPVPSITPTASPSLPPAPNSEPKPSAPPAVPVNPVVVTGTEPKGDKGMMGTGQGQPPAPKTEDGPKADPKKDSAPADPQPAPEAKRIILRSGTMEFEVPSFDAAAATITKSVLGLKGAFIATINSDKLPNGKVRGSITVRTPPEHLDSLVLELRKELGKDGELKGIRISSQDVTKQYTDLESHLRAFRTMETRLIQIIKEGKGEIKQLLEAEKELAVWRTKIEEAEGEIRYFANLAAFSTLTISLMEKEIRAASSLTESERVQAGVEVDDVDKSYQEIMKAVIEAKGRITKSEVKQLAAGQYNATLNFEVPPDASGPIRDRLRQLGRVARLEIDRLQQPEGGTMPTDAKLKRGDTVFMVQLYNLANIAARETITLQIAVQDVPAAFQTLRDAVGKVDAVDGKITARVFTAKIDEQDRQNITAQLDFEVRRTNEGNVRGTAEKLGETVTRQVSRAAESDSVTDTKVLYRITVVPLARLRPRDTATLKVAVVDVPTAYQAIRDVVTKTTGRVLHAQLDEQDRKNITATLDLEVKRADEATIRAAFDAAGDVLSRQVTRATEGDAITDSKVRYTATLYSTNLLRPRDTATLHVAVTDVPAAYQAIRDAMAKTTGRVLHAQLDEQDRKNITATLDLEVKRADEATIRAAFDAAGDVLSRQVTRATEGDAITDSKVRYTATLFPANRLKARELTTLALEVGDVDGIAAQMTAQVAEAKGRAADAQFARDRAGRVTAKLVFEVPLTAAPILVERFKGMGTVRVAQSVRDTQATEGKFATARLDVTIMNPEQIVIVAEGEGLWSQVRRGLSYSATVLLTSVTWVVFGLCVVLPWAIIGYGAYRVVRRMFFATPATTPEATPPSAPPPASATT